jgi:hypothetical protein
MTLTSNEARLLVIICREVLDILDLPEDASQVKCVQIRDLIDSWVTANDLELQAVKRKGGVYVIEIKEGLEMLTFSERLNRFRKTLEQALAPLFN